MNRLAAETSPYLLQHAGNPVDWYAWGPEALERSRSEQRPILLSIGYSACHWCHVMERESFENHGTAALMNEHFVCIKVDREERPDLDSVYMDAVVSLTGSGGWPMTVFLTPAGEPFYGGTYYPPVPRHGMPAFSQILAAVAEAWRDRRADVEVSASRLAAQLASSALLEGRPEPLGAHILEAATARLAEGIDGRWGGWGRAPKFPPGPVLEFLLRRGETLLTRRTLDGMALGGMYDVIGGGFHRYSVDERWLVPHFEKMLYDNALLASAYLRGWQVLGDEDHREVARATIAYVLRELRLESGGFASAQDADTDGIEGLTFTWARGEGVPDESLEEFEDDRFVVRGRLDEELRLRLLDERSLRPQPLRDDKAIASWNGLMLAALADGARILGEERWLDAARSLGDFLLGPLSTPDGRLHRTWRDGVAKGTGYLEDYADVAHGLIALHVATGEPRWLREAHRLALLAVDLFGDDDGAGFFQTPRDGERLVARKKELDDHPTPSGNAMLAFVLLRLARIWDDDELEQRAVATLGLVGEGLGRVPSAYGWMLVALDQHLAPRRELAIVGPAGGALAHVALALAAPTDVVAFGPADDIPLLEGKSEIGGKPAVYRCERFTCAAPVVDPAAL